MAKGLLFGGLGACLAETGMPCAYQSRLSWRYYMDAAGHTAATIPVDIVKVRMQVAAKGGRHSMLGTLRAILRHEGAGALFKGLSPSLARQVTCT